MVSRHSGPSCGPHRVWAACCAGTVMGWRRDTRAWLPGGGRWGSVFRLLLWSPGPDHTCLPTVHRIGRTGRSGNTGIATTFINKACGEEHEGWSAGLGHTELGRASSTDPVCIAKPVMG